MAEITNGATGSLYLAVKLDVLRKEPEAGMIHRGNVLMNSSMELLWVEASFWIGDAVIYAQEVLLHSVDVRRFTQMLKELITNVPPHMDRQTRSVRFEDITSPELHFLVEQTIYDSGGNSYEIRVMIDPGIQNGSPGVAGEGPAMMLQPEEKDLLAFARDLQSEAEMTLLLG